VGVFERNLIITAVFALLFVGGLLIQNGYVMFSAPVAALAVRFLLLAVPRPRKDAKPPR
jgi:hypothetical protein